MSNKNYNHSHDHNKSTSNLMIAFIINLVFTIIEVFAGLYTNSIAILSDAVHDLGDSISLGMSAFLERISKKEPDEKYTFGYQRFSLLGALISSLVLFGGTVYILTETIPRLLNPQEVDAKGMLLFSIVGIIFNGLAYYRIHGGTSLNERTVSLHLLEDLFGWVAILIGSFILLFVDWYMLDAIMSILISIFILYHVYRNLKQIFAILLQRAPQHIDVKSVKMKIQSIKGVISAYHIHLWSSSDEDCMMSVHITINPSTTLEEMAKLKVEIKKVLSEYHLHHITIEFERVQDKSNGNKECVD